VSEKLTNIMEKN